MSVVLDGVRERIEKTTTRYSFRYSADLMDYVVRLNSLRNLAPRARFELANPSVNRCGAGVDD